METLPATVEAGAPPATIQAETDAARDFALAEKSDATRRAYRSDFAGFSAWCRARNAEPMPASPEGGRAKLNSPISGFPA
jgi:hypothetical protein